MATLYGHSLVRLAKVSAQLSAIQGLANARREHRLETMARTAQIDLDVVLESILRDITVPVDATADEVGA